MEQFCHFIDGRFHPSTSWIDVTEPATGAVYAHVARGTADDVNRAVQAAEAAFPLWAELPAAERAAYLYRIADELEKRLEEFARAESQDQGKPIALARSLDIPRSIANLRFFAAAALHVSTEAHPAPGMLNYTLRQPVGVVGCISPWNLPLYLFTWKIAPAIAFGNTVVAKPSELTPRTATMFAALCKECALPAGVLNVVHGYGSEVGAAIVEHPRIRAISFTGSTTTGEYIARTAGPHFKKLSLELGGKNPTIIFADADLETALPTIVRAGFLNQGEICLCGSRVLVERSIYDTFVERFCEKVRSLRVGDPLDEHTEIGALVSEAHYHKVLNAIANAERDGGQILVGGKPAYVDGRCKNGWFVEPTVIVGLKPSCAANQEEIFGPVVTILPFDDEEEAIRIANSVRYGLAASIWTQNLRRAHAVAAQIECGVVWVNCWMLRDLRTPFGGIKASGIGREGGWEAYRFFTEAKNVCIKL
ncbi:MAG: aldehyde dehydrogenase [Bacteroidota bacterium]|nr:aldehyde dehydrogenase [Candidatus Kapabacteria bacterium]MCS7301920.1 aldehyde dehydrogenase [Candidatus Kapabacteria bacterium]MCX7936624.1 aldehyde dehydrogenase [Chlorobiota bacterium]MDW8074817.1 aldehyde dehydrogenase [Bacteroidota bacterium]MDW8271456.1 aldehyde dehydrogenase [Bacteroidota bacterium]